MRTQIQEPWVSQPLWRWMLGPKRAALAAKLHTQHLACKSFWVLWKHSSLMMPLFCKSIIVEVKWLAPLSLSNSAATPEIESCPVLLTALQDLKTLQTLGAGEGGHPWSPCPQLNTKAHLAPEAIMVLETWSVPPSSPNPPHLGKWPKEGNAG